MTVALSGGGGFLGFHTRSLLHSLGIEVSMLGLGDNYDAVSAAQSISGRERVIHLAGINRGTDEEVRGGNIRLAEQLARTLLNVGVPPRVVVYANSIHSDGDTNYGEAKAAASTILMAAAARVGAEYVDIKLPNLFGEHGRPFYNSVVATFCHLLVTGQTPEVVEDRELELLHAQRAAELLIGDTAPDELRRMVSRRTVSDVLARLRKFSTLYDQGDIPDLSSSFDLDLFNTYRSFRAGPGLPIPLNRKADSRGSFFEVCRSQGGAAQTSFSTTAPGVTRGKHFHRRKVERFVVLSGSAEITMRRLFTEDVLRFRVDGSNPVAIDMPSLWAHDITNIGAEDLYTMFWTNDIYDPANPDTFAEEV